MLKRQYIVLWTSAVLIFGLVSCAPKQKEMDVFRSPPPIIVRSGSSVELQAWNQSEQKVLDFGDAFDFRSSGAARVDVTAECWLGTRDLSRTIQTAVAKPVAVFQTLPFEVLTNDPHLVPVRCTWDVALANAIGSRHIFKVGPATVTAANVQTADLTLEDRSQPLAPNAVLHRADLERIRFRSSVPGRVRLICQSQASRETHIEDTLMLAVFEQRRVAQAAEICRIARIEGVDLVTSISAPFQLSLTEGTVIKFVDLPNRSFSFDANRVYRIIQGEEFVTATIRAENPENFSRIFRMSKRALFVDSMMVMKGVEQTKWPTGHFNFLNPSLQPGPGVTIEETKDFFLIRMPAHSFFELRPRYRYLTAGGPCANGTVAGVHISFPEPAALVEVNEKGDELNTQLIELGPPILLGVDQSPALFENLRFQLNPKCPWRG